MHFTALSAASNTFKKESMLLFQFPFLRGILSSAFEENISFRHIGSDTKGLGSHHFCGIISDTSIVDLMLT